MINYKNIIKTNKLEDKVSLLIELGNKASNQMLLQRIEFRNTIDRHNYDFEKLKQFDIPCIRKNIRITEIMLSKTFVKLQAEIFDEERELYIDLLLKSISKYREDLKYAYVVEKRRLLILAVIHTHNKRCVAIKNSKYIKRIEKLIKNKQKEQINLSTIIIDKVTIK